jgi:ferritin-like metal-binding protein YciE
VENNRIDEELNQWPRNAHAMEEQAEKLLGTQSRRIENYPELAAGIDLHLSETRHQDGWSSASHGDGHHPQA